MGKLCVQLFNIIFLKMRSSKTLWCNFVWAENAKWSEEAITVSAHWSSAFCPNAIWRQCAPQIYHIGASWTEGWISDLQFWVVLLKIYFFPEFFFLTIVNASKWHTGITCSISQKNVTHVWKIHEKPLKFGVFPNFEGLKVEKVFFTRAKIKPWGTTFSFVPLVLWNIHKQKCYKQLYFWLNLLSHICLFEPMWKPSNVTQFIITENDDGATYHSQPVPNKRPKRAGHNLAADVASNRPGVTRH